jgi:hypothetical protein
MQLEITFKPYEEATLYKVLVLRNSQAYKSDSVHFLDSDLSLTHDKDKAFVFTGNLIYNVVEHNIAYSQKQIDLLMENQSESSRKNPYFRVAIPINKLDEIILSKSYSFFK